MSLLTEMARGDNLRSQYYRFTVEDCIVLDLYQLNSLKEKGFRDFVLSTAVGKYLIIVIDFYISNELKAKVLAVIEKTQHESRIVLLYKNNIEEVEQRIHLSYQKLISGGLKFYIHCNFCGRRGNKLYFVPRKNRFMCRNCGHLTYQSCKESEGITYFNRLISNFDGLSLYQAKQFTNLLQKEKREVFKTIIIEKPYIKEEKMHTTTIKLGNKQNKELDELSKVMDLTKSELIRRAIDILLNEERIKILNNKLYNDSNNAKS